MTEPIAFELQRAALRKAARACASAGHDRPARDAAIKEFTDVLVARACTKQEQSEIVRELREELGERAAAFAYQVLVHATVEAVQERRRVATSPGGR